jgi:hypothetical protein
MSWADQAHRFSVALLPTEPVQEEQYRIDLIIVATAWKSQQFRFEFGKPRSSDVQIGWL